jgi:hypothetical protein
VGPLGALKLKLSHGQKQKSPLANLAGFVVWASFTI